MTSTKFQQLHLRSELQGGQGAPCVQDSMARENLSASLAMARTPQQLADWNAHFQLAAVASSVNESRFDETGLGLDGEKLKRPQRTSRYFVAVESKMDWLAHQLASPTERFAESVDTISEENPTGIPLDEPAGNLQEPEEVVKTFLEQADVGMMLFAITDDAEKSRAALQSAAHVLVQARNSPVTSCQSAQPSMLITGTICKATSRLE